jgi:hypothetical protein
MARQKDKEANGQHQANDTSNNINGQPPATPASDTIAPTEQIPWKDAVREGREILARDRADKLRLGELADKIEPKYGDRTMAKFAEALGINKSTLNHYRTTYRAWKIVPPAAKSTPYAVLEVLATIDDRVAVITAEPNMSKRRAEVHRVVKDDPKRDEILSDPDLTCTTKARALMAGGAERRSGDFSKDRQRYLKDVCNSQEELRKKATEGLEATDEQLDDLAQIAGELTLKNLRADAKVVVALAEVLLERRRQLEDQEAEAQAAQPDPEDAEAPQATEHVHPEASIQAEA